MSLRFTAAGAVASPTTVQIRVGRRYGGRLAAGAPIPSRSLTTDELLANLRWFLVEMAGPRAVACDAVVLSGVDLASDVDLDAAIRQARADGVRHLSTHRDGDELAAGAQRLPSVDAASVIVRSEAAATAVRAVAASHVAAVVPLHAPVLTRLDLIVTALIAAAPDRVVLTWPFPPGEAPAPPASVRAALDRILPLLDQACLGVSVKGLPACLLGDHRDRLTRSRNRWYVDAAHQRADAMLFFPDVVRFSKGDDCRFCALDGRCDGVAETWASAGCAGPLVPVRSSIA